MNNQPTFRPSDLARAVDLSVQMVRNYERWGFLPPAERSPTGYRIYRPRHMQAIHTARQMIAGYGWQNALSIMQALHQDDTMRAFAIVDAQHARLDSYRREVERMLSALHVIARESDGHDEKFTHPPRLYSIGEIASDLGVRPSAIRFWEEQRLIRPRRNSANRYRQYDQDQYRQLQIVVLLRKAGYNFDAIRPVLAELQRGRTDRAIAAATARLTQLAEESRRCCAATVAFWNYVSATSSPESSAAAVPPDQPVAQQP